MRNTVTVHIDKKLVPDSYPIGTLFEVDERSDGMSSGVYMLAASGTPGCAILVNLGFGTLRNGLIPERKGLNSITESDLREDIGRGTTYRVVQHVTILAGTERL